LQLHVQANHLHFIWAHGLLLWRQMRNQVFQDDVRERKREEGEDIRDLHRYPIDNSLPAICSSCFFLSQMRNLPNLINFDFQACFWNDGLLLISESSSFWKQATTNKIGLMHKREDTTFNYIK
jgi:hypothetical protein